MNELLPVAQTIGLIVGIVTLVGIAVKIGRQAATIEVTQVAMAKELGELKELRKELSQVPLLVQRLGFAENTVARLLSDVRELRESRAARKAVERWSQHDE